MTTFAETGSPAAAFALSIGSASESVTGKPIGSATWPRPKLGAAAPAGSAFVSKTSSDSA